MWPDTWTPDAVRAEAKHWRGGIWRMVEAQHLSSTMKLVDSAAEQALLEGLLERHKPPIPEAARHLDYLLATPFRYPARPGGSRFRAETDPGVFYGAGLVRTVCAELGYHRWRFLRDARDLERLEPVWHTAFRARVAAATVDLRRPPFAEYAHLWADRRDYSACQAFAELARRAAAGAIRYRSVRDPKPGWCLAVLDPAAFSSPRPSATMQTWTLTVHPDQVIWQRRPGEAFVFDTKQWE